MSECAHEYKKTADPSMCKCEKCGKWNRWYVALAEKEADVEKYRQALNRVLGFVVDCPSSQGIKNGIDKCDCGVNVNQCDNCWKIALGVEKYDG